MAELIRIPPETDADFLTRVRRYIKIAEDFKRLVIELSIEDLSGSDYFDGDLTDADTDDDGRLFENFQIAHGHYTVKLSDQSEIDPITNLDVSINLARPEGGRIFKLSTDSQLGALLELSYYEDLPLLPGMYKGTEDVLSRFKLTRENARDLGIHYSEASVFRDITKNIKAVQTSGRLVVANQCRCI